LSGLAGLAAFPPASSILSLPFFSFLEFIRPSEAIFAVHTLDRQKG